MKYRLLTEEEQTGFRTEFIRFLAVNGLDAPSWDRLKSEQKVQADKIFEDFSDFIFESLIEKIQYLEFFNGDNLMLFKCDAAAITLIWLESEADFDSVEAMIDALPNMADKFSISREVKPYHVSRNVELFKMAESGAKIVDNKIFDFLAGFLPDNNT